MVECQLPKLDVAGSNPVSRSIFSVTLTHLADQLLSQLSRLDALGSDLKALKSDQSAVAASRRWATEDSTYFSR